ncbi:MAG TPA: hypothetical protein PLK99_01195 [Burkholderiales bacterium]|nr:hypothetical protein [Burkholderiales bacterium]
MKCHILIPDLFWRDSGFRIDALPHLETLLAKGEKTKHGSSGLEEWIFRTFHVKPQHDWPVAPLTADKDSGYWLRADPVNLQVRRDHLTLLGPDMLSISESESEAIIESFNRHFETDGLHFAKENPHAWLIRLPESPHLSTTPLFGVIGRDIAEHLPKGEDALKWNQVTNEIQMLLHDHPVNERREQDGKHPINSVWLWGGGIFPDNMQSPFSSITSTNPVSKGIAKETDTLFHPLPENAADWLSNLDKTGEHLLILENLRLPFRYRDGDEWDSGLRKLESNWFAPLHLAVQNGLDLSIVDCESGMRFETARLDLFKFWRRNRSVLDY